MAKAIWADVGSSQNSAGKKNTTSAASYNMRTGASGTTSTAAKTGGTSSGKSTAGTAAPAPAAGGDGGSGGLDLLTAFLEAQQRARDEAYKVALEQQNRDYEYARGQLDSSTDKALKEAYINKMLSLLHLPQDMAAQGLGGGASETTLGSLHNNYGSARAALETERQRQLAGLLNTHQGNLAQLAAQRASGAQTALNAYATQLAKLMANNTPALLSLTQAGGEGDSLYYRLRRLLSWDEE